MKGNFESGETPAPAAGRTLAAVVASLVLVALGFTPWSFDLLAAKGALLMAAFPVLVLLALAPRLRGGRALAVGLLAGVIVAAQILVGDPDPGAGAPRWGFWLLAAVLPCGLLLGLPRSGLQAAGRAPVPGPLLAISAVILIGRLRGTFELPGMAASAGLDQDLTLVMLLVAALLVRDAFWSRPRLLPAAGTLIGVTVAGLAILQKLGLDPFAAVNPGREAVSTFGNTNAAAGFLAPLFVLALTRALAPPIGLAAEPCAGTLARRIEGSTSWRVGAPVVIGVGLVLMASRGAALSVLAGTIFATLWLATHPARDRWPALWRRRLLVGPMAALAIGAGVFLARGVPPASPAPTTPRLTSTEQRLAILADTARMIAERPVTGHGAGSFRVVFPAYRRQELAAEAGRYGLPTEIDQPHNDYFWLAAERGLPASLLWIAALLGLLGIGWRATRIGPDLRRGIEGGAAAAAIMTLATGGLTFPVLSQAAPGLLLFTLAGIILAFRDEPSPPATFRVGRHLAGVGVGLVLLVTLAAGSRSLASRLAMARVGAMEAIDSGESFVAMHERLRRAVSLDPTNVDAARFDAAMLLTRCQAGDGAEWIAAARRALATLEARLPIDTSVPEGRALLALLEGDRTAALRQYRLATRRAPAGAPAPAERLRHTERRLASLGRLSLEPDVDAVARARALREAGRGSDARRLLDERLQQEPDDGDALHLLGLLLRDVGDEAEAERYLRQAQLAFAIEWILARQWDRAATNLRIARRYTDHDDEERALEALMLLLQGDREGAIRKITAGEPPAFARFAPFVQRATLPVRRLLE